jgi:hypothetical protein
MSDKFPWHYQLFETGSSSYRFRAMYGIIIVEIICIILVNFWPSQKAPNLSKPNQQRPEVTQLKAPVATVQNGTPPPKSTLAPIPVPNDQPIQQKIKINFNKYSSNSSDTLSNAPPGAAGKGKAIVGNPNVFPRVTRIVEPTYEKSTNNKYEITVKFLVNKKGSVDEAKITAIYVLDKNGNREREVSKIDPKIKKAVIKAALNWKFIPAKNHGKPVRAYAKNYFTI